MTRRRPGSNSTTSYVYAKVRPKKRATKSIRDPTSIGGGVCHFTEEMLAYQFGALDGSVAYAATWSHGRAMTTSVTTSTAMLTSWHACGGHARNGGAVRRHSVL